MVYNSTNINKTNSHLWPQTIEYKKTMTFGVGNSYIFMYTHFLVQCIYNTDIIVNVLFLLQDDEDKPPDAPFRRIISYNSPEWPQILFGCIAACLNGGIQPAFAVIFSELIGVSISVMVHFYVWLFHTQIWTEVLLKKKNHSYNKSIPKFPHFLF